MLDQVSQSNVGPRGQQSGRRPLIVALSGTTRPNSSTEFALRIAVEAARGGGADVQFFGGADLDLPLYSPEIVERTPRAQRLVAALRQSDGILIASPNYHGGLPGLVKNALDYVEDLRDEPAPYFDGRPVGCILTGSGAQGAVTALTSLRAVIHALRGWPTPLGVCINTSSPVFDETGVCLVDSVQPQLVTVGLQVVRFAVAARASAELSRPA